MNTSHSFNGFPPTPQSAKFGAQHFYSPPTADGSPTDFHNGWMTPQDYTFTTSFQTPGGSLDHGILEEPSSSSSATSLKRPRPESYQNLIPKLETKKNTPAVIIPQDMSHLAFPTTSFLEQFDGTHLDEFTHMPTSIPIQHVQVEQMPTPPPTRDAAASARRKANRMRQVMVPAHMAAAVAPPRRMSVPDEAWTKQPEQLQTLPQSASFNLDNLQLDMPELYGFDMTGPMTAPAYPQGQVFWDPNASVDGGVDLGHSTMPMLTQGLMPQSNVAPAPFVFSAAPVPRSSRSQDQGFAVPSLPSQGSRPHTAHSSRASDAAAARARASTMQSVHMRKASSVDPSVLFTAGAPGAQPVAAAPGLLRSNSVASSRSATESVQPYQYQNEALRREKQERARRVDQVSRSGSVDASVESHSAVPLHRSGSTSGRTAEHARRTPNPSVDLAASFAEQGPHIPRNPSPLKQQKSASTDMPPPAKPLTRRPVVLSIDSQGRAITTAKSSQTKAAHRKAPSKVAFRNDDESASESDSEDEDLPCGPTRSRASTLAGAGGLARSRSLRTSPTRHDGLTRTRSLRTSPTKNEAQQALHEAVKDRRKKSMDIGKTFQCALPAGADPFVSAPSFAMPPPPPPTQAQFLPPRQDSGVWNISPTAPRDPNMHTPPADFEKQFLESTRCVCNNMLPNDGQLMVQCESCTNWLHVACLGLNTQALPPVFVCAFCVQAQQQQHQHHQQPQLVAVPAGQQIQYFTTMPYGMHQMQPMQPIQQMQHFM